MVRGCAFFVCGLVFLLLFCFLLFFFDAHKPPSSYGTHFARWFGARNVQLVRRRRRLFLVFCVCLNFEDHAKQWRKIFKGVSEVGKNIFSVYFCRLCVFFLVFHFSLLRSHPTGEKSEWVWPQPYDHLYVSLRSGRSVGKEPDADELAEPAPQFDTETAVEPEDLEPLPSDSTTVEPEHLGLEPVPSDEIIAEDSHRPDIHLDEDWWLHATKGERRNYIRTLIPNSLSNALREIPPDTPYFQHLKNLKTAFKYRRKRLKTALQETQTWLRQNPINDLHLLQPDSADNPWNNQYSIHSTSSHNPTLLTYPKRTNTTVTNKHPHKHRHVHSKNKKNQIPTT